MVLVILILKQRKKYAPLVLLLFYCVHYSKMIVYLATLSFYCSTIQYFFTWDSETVVCVSNTDIETKKKIRPLSVTFILQRSL
ncbi:Uncharacterized protein APZ42_009689 [Daphnia magna]|uniref:Uncharacterized protein n=1 Tax=Daphnia magna TaxID=35525 RepID=A0A0P6APF7_9CRUS|nr:Uncharacterized protein APZ42_009689 [Daphnia magna]